MSLFIRSIDDYSQGIARFLAWENSDKGHFCQFMFTVFKFFALVVAIYSCYIHFLWGIRCLYAFPFVQTNQYLLQIFTS